MTRYYTKVCNFYYGKESRLLVKKKKTQTLKGKNKNKINQNKIIKKK